MNLRQKLQVFLLLLFTFFAFAAYHSGTGGTGWLQWLTVVSFLVFTLVFDMAFTNQSQFLFDPDAENWRRKTVRIGCCFDAVLFVCLFVVTIGWGSVLPGRLTVAVCVALK